MSSSALLFRDCAPKQVTLSGYKQVFPNLGFPVVGGGEEERGSLIVELEVEFPPKLREVHLAALRVVLTEEEIAILEDVLKLMSARKVRGLGTVA